MSCATLIFGLPFGGGRILIWTRKSDDKVLMMGHDTIISIVIRPKADTTLQVENLDMLFQNEVVKDLECRCVACLEMPIHTTSPAL